MGASIVGEIVEILTSGITGIATAIGSGLSDLAKSVFLQTTGTGADATTTLSVFGTIVCVFAGISLCIGLSRLVVSWVMNFGK